MNYQEFMRLPLESRKAIEQCIIDLDKAVQDHYGFSMLKAERETMREQNQGSDLPTTGQDSKNRPSDAPSGGTEG